MRKAWNEVEESLRFLPVDSLSDSSYFGNCHEKPLLWYYRSLLVLTLGHHKDGGGVGSLPTT